MFDGSMQELVELGYGFDSFWQRGYGGFILVWMCRFVCVGTWLSVAVRSIITYEQSQKRDLGTTCGQSPQLHHMRTVNSTVQVKHLFVGCSSTTLVNM